MICPNCRADIPDDSNACSYCKQPIVHVREVIDAELVDSPKQEQQQKGFYHRRVVFAQTDSNSLCPSCLMSIITFTLALVLGNEYGALAFIGFLVFAAIARIVTFLINIQMVMMGRPLNPLLIQILSWFCCWSLVTWLAS